MRSPSPLLRASVATGFFATGILACALAGCSASSSGNTPAPPTTPTTYAGVGFGGKAMAGNQPLVGASVQLYAAGTTGSGSSGTALLTPALTTNSSGAFTVPASYVCPTDTSQLYLVARGGQAGAAANSAIAFFTALGACNQIAASSQFVTNEVTTVAAAYALAQLLSPGANLGASSTNTVGLGNAVATAQALANITTGSSPGSSFAANGASPAAAIDSVANLLNACTVATPGTSACTSLFAATTVPGASAPTNTLDAVLNLVRNPAANVAALYALSTASTAFTPALTSAPPDWTLSVNYTGGGMNSPSGLGIDANGNVWVANYFNVASLFSPLGKPLVAQGITGGGLSASYGLAVDANGNAWIPDEPGTTLPGNSVSVLNISGASVAGSTGYTVGGLDYPIAVAIDTDGSAWVADYGNSHLTHLSSSGAALSGAAGYTSPLLAFPAALAIDSSHNVWVGNQGDTTVTRVSSNGTQFTSFTCCDDPSALAFDQHGNLWIANYYGNSVSQIAASGSLVSVAGYAGGGIDHPQGIAIDGAGNVWIANFRGNALSQLASASAAVPGAVLSPSGGIGSAAGLLEPFALAVDASGNIWVSNFGSNILTEYIGLAAPVRTPLLTLPAAP